MAARILANLIVAGGTVVFRAAVQAYKQALVNAAQGGVTPENLSRAARSSRMALEEAEQILGISRNASLKEVLEKYNHLFERNEKEGSFYLLSKVHRARERLEEELGPLEEAKPEAGSSGTGQDHDRGPSP